MHPRLLGDFTAVGKVEGVEKILVSAGDMAGLMDHGLAGPQMGPVKVRVGGTLDNESSLEG
jgi:hypothetical protein